MPVFNVEALENLSNGEMSATMALKGKEINQVFLEGNAESKVADRALSIIVESLRNKLLQTMKECKTAKYT